MDFCVFNSPNVFWHRCKVSKLEFIQHSQFRLKKEIEIRKHHRERKFVILVYIFDENQKLVKSKDVKISVSLFAEQ